MAFVMKIARVPVAGLPVCPLLVVFGAAATAAGMYYYYYYYYYIDKKGNGERIVKRADTTFSQDLKSIAGGPKVPQTDRSVPEDSLAEAEAKNLKDVDTVSKLECEKSELMVPQEKIRVVLLACGSFNPITNMHLRMFELARDHLQDTGRNQVVKGIISPVGDGYKKKGLIEACHRVEMARLATESSSWISVDDWESQQAEWVETIKVIRHHYAELSTAERGLRRLEDNEESVSNDNRSESLQLMLLCGADMLESFSIPNLWKKEDIVEIMGCFGLVCITRSGCNTEKFVYQSEVLQKYRKNIHIVREWVHNEISATRVRQAVCRGQSVRYLLPEPVVCYIQEQHLYNVESEQKNADVLLAPLQKYGSAV